MNAALFEWIPIGDASSMLPRSEAQSHIAGQWMREADANAIAVYLITGDCWMNKATMRWMVGFWYPAFLEDGDE